MYNMNEKIEDFARQSGLYKILTEHAGEFGGGDLTNTPYPELEKFAELLIRECAQIANNSNQSRNRAAGQSVGDVVIEHFGVE